MTAPDLSLNEVEATARKAARGAGRDWGVAEDAGHAARWLCAQGLDGCAAMAAALNAGGTGPAAPQMPDWRAKAGPLCPLSAGLALADGAVRLSPVLHNVAAPLMLLPFAAMAARQVGTPVTLSWDGGQAVTDGDRLSLNGTPEGARMSVRPDGTLGTVCAPRTRTAPDPAAWSALLALAQRTYAPATEESRRRGAGSDLSDND